VRILASVPRGPRQRALLEQLARRLRARTEPQEPWAQLDLQVLQLLRAEAAQLQGPLQLWVQRAEQRVLSQLARPPR